jgi:hypothetical protein
MLRSEVGGAVLDLSAVDKAEFRIVSEGGFHLVFPKRNKWDWAEDEKWLRSVVVDDAGRIVSCSWKKFGNFGEFLAETKALEKALADGCLVRFTAKEDGSLCIRSVFGGRVVMRTRGTLFGGKSDDGSETYGERFHRVAAARYPRLLDPLWMPDVSLLLEYVAPDNAIVVRYKKDDLVFLGGVEHSIPSIIPWETVVRIAAEGGLRLVELRELPSDPILLLKEVKEWRTEGVVARCCGDQVLVKVKSAWYLANHRMKYSMDYKSIVEFSQRADVGDEDALVAKLREYDYDFEVIESAKEFFRRYVLALRDATRMRADAEEACSGTLVGLAGLERGPEHRKRFAAVACSREPAVRSMMFALYDGRLERVDAMVRKLILAGGGGRGQPGGAEIP